MTNLREFHQMSHEDMLIAKAHGLVDINHIRIDPNLPALERMEKYLHEIHNPYCFLCGNITVRVCFPIEGDGLSSHLKKYFSNRKI